MCAGISRGLCGSHTLDIPIETVKNRWSLGVDTMKQISEPGGGVGGGGQLLELSELDRNCN